MEISLENAKIIQDHHEYKPAKKCPKCNSVFLTETECESCNYQLGYDFLGEPLGERSFYTLREQYWNDLGSVSKIHHSLEKQNPARYDSYKRKVLLRYNVLLDYFYDSHRSVQDENRPLFLQELKDVILELIKYDVPEETIWHKVDEATDLVDTVSVTPLYQKIALAVEEGRARQKLEKGLIESFFEYRLFGLFRLSTAIISVLGLSALIVFALFFYKYQALMN